MREVTDNTDITDNTDNVEKADNTDNADRPSCPNTTAIATARIDLPQLHWTMWCLPVAQTQITMSKRTQTCHHYFWHWKLWNSQCGWQTQSKAWNKPRVLNNIQVLAEELCGQCQARLFIFCHVFICIMGFLWKYLGSESCFVPLQRIWEIFVPRGLHGIHAENGERGKYAPICFFNHRHCLGPVDVGKAAVHHRKPPFFALGSKKLLVWLPAPVREFSQSEPTEGGGGRHERQLLRLGKFPMGMPGRPAKASSWKGNSLMEMLQIGLWSSNGCTDQERVTKAKSKHASLGKRLSLPAPICEWIISTFCVVSSFPYFWKSFTWFYIILIPLNSFQLPQNVVLSRILSTPSL